MHKLSRILTGAALWLVLCLVVQTAGTAVGRAAVDPRTTTTALASYQNPVVASDSPDPDVIRSGGIYYAFTTASDYVNIPEYTSTDLAHWARTPGDALPQLPRWSSAGRTWAPGVISYGGHWYLYYATTQTSSGLQCISRATAAAAGGPYVDNSSGPLICQANLGGSIDPDPFVDPSGRGWIYWKSEGRNDVPAQLWASRLTSSGLLTGTPTPLLSADASLDRGVIENPFMIRAADGYVMLFSQGHWDTSGYAVGYAVCAGPGGPCVRPDAPPVLESSASVLGPGGESAFTDAAGHSWLAYHAWSAPASSYGAGGSRTLRVDRLTFSGTTPVVAGPSTAVGLLNAPERIAGDDRYATAAALSAHQFPDGAPVAYVATGLSYPDALAAGPVAAQNGGPILLVSPAGVPDATAAELGRLQPSQIVVLGGPAAVPPSVVSALSAYAPVTRWSGPDRYATAAAVSAGNFPTGASTAYLATGASYADALAGAAAAGVQGAPVLLTEPTGLPSATRTELARLRPHRIFVLGGSAAVSDQVVNQLDQAGYAVSRLAGRDRYATAAAVADAAFRPSVSEVLIATGLSYPDALAASAVGQPVLLAPTTGYSPAATQALARLAPRRLVPVGGPGALPDAAVVALSVGAG